MVSEVGTELPITVPIHPQSMTPQLCVTGFFLKAALRMENLNPLYYGVFKVFIF